jgi:putative oxidoreductase
VHPRGARWYPPRVLNLVYPPFATGRTAVGLLALRVLAGTAMAFHGWPKIQDPLHWRDKAADPPHEILQLLAAISEFVGGIGLAVGLLTPLCCLGILATMGFALEMHLGRGDAFVKPGKPSWELAAIHATISFAVLLAGPGRWSADFFLLGRRRGEAPPA